MKTNVICTECPMGCTVSVEHNDGCVLSVSGNGCPRGKQYASDEVICPRRVLTTTVRTADGRVTPVKTSRGIPKNEIGEAMQKVSALRVKAPISLGDVLLPEISEGTDLVATAALDLPTP